MLVLRVLCFSCHLGDLFRPLRADSFSAVRLPYDNSIIHELQVVNSFFCFLLFFHKKIMRVTGCCFVVKVVKIPKKGYKTHKN